MKRTLLFSCLLGLSVSAMAQVTLSTSPYTQNFNTLGSGIPSGWRVYGGSKPTTVGTLKSVATSAATGVFNDTTCGATAVSSGGFKNYASANATTEGTSCTAQQSTSDRALGVRQVSKTNATNGDLDSGAAFVLVLSGTTGLTDFNLSFKLQSLDTSSARTTKWIVDYGIGSNPTTFTPVTTSPASLTTGGHTFSNTSVTVNFGSALNNQSSNVFIRVVTLEESTGSGNRASTAIDDVSLTFTGSVGIEDVTNNGNLPFTVVGTPTSSSISFNCAAPEAGNYTLSLFDMTGRQVYNDQMLLNNGAQTRTINTNLASGMYVAKLSNGATTSSAKVIVQ